MKEPLAYNAQGKQLVWTGLGSVPVFNCHLIIILLTYTLLLFLQSPFPFVFPWEPSNNLVPLR